MLFNSFSYLIYLPVVAIIYFLLPKKLRNYWLLAASLFFYGCWRAEYLLLIVFSILATYFCSLLLEKFEGDARRKKTVLALSFAANLAILFFFKYFNFAAATINALAAREAVHFLDVALPVGISFYTFQALGYTVDVYRGDIKAQHNIFTYALFVCFFPQLVAGPIERSENLLPQFETPHRFDYDEMLRGLLLILWGFFQKLMIADRLAIFVDAAFDSYETVSGWSLIIASVFFALQIYCDFASYSNIAIGSAQIMGFKLMKNFDAPYFSRSLGEFWNRWHISLSSWLRDYLYIPLGGNRRGTARRALNLLIVFLVSGLWHGAAWTFVCWGLIHGVGRVIGTLTSKLRTTVRERLGLEHNALWSFARILFTFLFVVVSFVFFRADSVGQALGIIGAWFTRFPGTDTLALGLDAADMTVALASVAVLALVDILARKTDLREKLLALPLAARWAFTLAAMAVIAVFGIYGPAYSAAPFIYFQF